MIFGMIIGIGIGFFFKPQIEDGLHKVADYMKERRNKHPEEY
jgi:hypothetical protein